MKTMMIAAATVLSMPFALDAQMSAQQEIERALAAAPARAREGAMVVRWNADYTYETLKEGTNTWVCYDRSRDPGQPAFSVQCTSRANLPRVAQNRRFAAEAADRQALRAMVAAADADGTRVPAEYGSPWLTMRGQSMEAAGLHTTIAVPGATGESTGLPESGAQGGAWVMAGGTSEAHIMIPG